MIQPEEFRLGNLITSDGEIFAIDKIEKDLIQAGALEVYPAGFELDLCIPLSEDWLKRFGFEDEREVLGDDEDTAGGREYWNKGEGLIVKDGRFFLRDVGTSHIYGDTVYTYTEIKYVHQLQNLFHSLTGEELTLSDDLSDLEKFTQENIFKSLNT